MSGDRFDSAVRLKEDIKSDAFKPTYNDDEDYKETESEIEIA